MSTLNFCLSREDWPSISSTATSRATSRVSSRRRRRIKSDFKSNTEYSKLAKHDEEHQRTAAAASSRDHSSQRSLVEQIQAEKLAGVSLYDGEQSLARAQRLFPSEMNANRCHFLKELVQNSDDNSYAPGTVPTLRFELLAKGLHVANNEKGFSREDVLALCFCDVCASRKKDSSGLIGQKGIGFKSVFTCCRSAYIRSGGFSFRLIFNISLGLIVPEWIDDFPVPPLDGFNTSIFLEMNANEIRAELRNELCPELLLFLRRLRALELHDNDFSLSFLRRTDGHVVKLEDAVQSETLSSFLLFAKEAPVPEGLVSSQREQESAEVACAFPIDARGFLTAGATQHVFAFLPIRDSGFRFALHADFEVVAGRDDLVEDSNWNEWLCLQAAELFCEAAELFCEAGDISGSWLSFLPIREEVILACFKPFLQHLIGLLCNSECIPTARSQRPWSKPLAVALCDSEFLSIFDTSWIHAVTGKDCIVDTVDLDQNRSALEMLGCDVAVESIMFRCLAFNLKLGACPAVWFAKFYSYAAKFSARVEVMEELRWLHILPLRSGKSLHSKRVAAVDGMVFMLDVREGVNLPEPPPDVQVLHPLALPQEGCLSARSFLEGLGLRVATPRLIIMELILPRYSSETGMSINTSIDDLLYLQQVLCESSLGSANFNSRTLLDRCRSKIQVCACSLKKAETRTWLSPRECYLRSEGTQAFLASTEGAWIIDSRYGKAGVSPQILSSVGCRASVRFVRAEPHKVRWEEKNTLAQELDIDPWDLGPTCEHYVIESWDLAPEVKRAMHHQQRAPELLKLLDKDWQEVKKQLTSVDLICFHKDSSIKCSKHGRYECAERICAKVQTIAPPPESQFLDALSRIRTMRVHTTCGNDLPTTQCFSKSSALVDFFGETLPYLPVDVDEPGLRAALGIVGELTVDMLLARLVQLAPRNLDVQQHLCNSSITAETFAVIARIYSHLCLCSKDATICSRIRSTFSTHPVIVTASGFDESTPHARLDVTWCRASHASWTGNANLCGGTFVALENGLPAELRKFFVDIVGVPFRAGGEALLCALSVCSLETKNVSKHASLQLELARELAYSSVNGLMSSAEEVRIRLLGRQPVFLTCAGTCVSAGSHVFIADDARHLDELQHAEAEIASRVLDVDSRYAAEMQPLASFFGFTLLSERVNSNVDGSCLDRARGHSEWTARLKSSIHHCARLVHDAWPECLEGVKRAEVIENWCKLRRSLRCSLVPDLVIKQSVEGLIDDPMHVRCDVFADHVDQQLLIDASFAEKGSVWLDVAAEVCHLFAVKISATRLESLQHRIQLLLSASGSAEMQRLFEHGTLRRTRPLPQYVMDRLAAAAAASQEDANGQEDAQVLSQTDCGEVHTHQHNVETCAIDGQPSGDGHAHEATWQDFSGWSTQQDSAHSWEPDLQGVHSGSHVSSFRDLGTSNSNSLFFPDAMHIQHSNQEWDVEGADGYEMPKLFARLSDAAADCDEICARVAEAWFHGSQDAASSDQSWTTASQSTLWNRYASLGQSSLVAMGQSQDAVPYGLPESALSLPWSHMAEGFSNAELPGVTLRDCISRARQEIWRSSVEAAVHVVRAVYAQNDGDGVMSGYRQRALWEVQEVLPVRDLRFTHHQISSKFGSGGHKGNRLQTLVDALNRGSVKPEALSLTGVCFNERVYVLNNRKLWALKQHDLHASELGTGPVCVPVFIYSLCPVTAKFILSYSTVDDGLSVQVGD